MRRILEILLTLIASVSLTSGHVNAPDPHLKRNQTMGIVLTQAFFDDIQYNLIVPAILNFESILNTTFQQPWFVNL